MNVYLAEHLSKIQQKAFGSKTIKEITIIGMICTTVYGAVGLGVLGFTKQGLGFKFPPNPRRLRRHLHLLTICRT